MAGPSNRTSAAVPAQAMSRTRSAGVPTTQATTPKRTKGIGFVNVRQFVLDRFDMQTWQRVVESLDADDRSQMDAIVAVGWYDLALFARVLRAIDTVCGRGDLRLLHEVGRYEAEADFNRALRLLMRVISPASLFGGHARLWRHYQDSGQWTLQHRPHSTDATLSGWGVDSALCAEITGYLGRLLEFSGGTQVTVTHVQCRAAGADTCVFTFRWK